MASLWQIEEAIMDCVDMETGEIIDIDRLDKLQMDRDTKIENIALYIKNLLSDAAGIKAEKDNLAQRQKVAENKANSLKKYLSGYLAGQKFSTSRVAISFRKSESVNIEDITAIPEEYLKYKDPEPDKTAIKSMLKSGKKVPGAELVQNQNIQIK